jgi:hypothetical protein
LDPHFLGLKSAAWLHPWVNAFQVVEQKAKKTEKQKKRKRKDFNLLLSERERNWSTVWVKNKQELIFLKRIVYFENDGKIGTLFHRIILIERRFL